MIDRDAITRESLTQRGSKKWSQYPGAIGAWIAEMDFGVADPIRAALRELDERDLYGYPPESDKARLRLATADFYARHFGWEFSPDRVSWVSDVLNGMRAVIDLYSAPGSAIIVPTPNYMPFFTLPGMQDRKVIEVPMIRTEDSWDFDLDGIAAAFDAGGGLLVMCNPHNPLGVVYSPDQLRAVADVVAGRNGRVFSDEIHAPLVYPGSQHTPYATVSDAAAEHTVTVTSSSKTFNTPGLKCAEVIFSNEKDLETWRTRGVFYADTPSNAGILAGIAAFNECEEWLADTRAYLQGNRDELAALVVQKLPGVTMRTPDATYLAWLDVRGLNLPGNLQEFFLHNAGVALTDGRLCGEAGAGHVRVNFGLPRPILRDLVNAMAGAVESR